MSTRSFIHVHMTDGQWGCIYCHSDGYWEHNGVRLQSFYNSQKMAEALIKLGDISYLGEEIGVKHAFDYHMKFYDKYKVPGQRFGTDYEAMHKDPEYIRLGRMCNVYGRDRGEKNTGARMGRTLADVFQTQQYMYVWQDGRWYGTNEYFEGDDVAPYIESLLPLETILMMESLARDESGWPETIRRRTVYRPPPPTKRALAL
jgi:hypothetical protein